MCRNPSAPAIARRLGGRDRRPAVIGLRMNDYKAMRECRKEYLGAANETELPRSQSHAIREWFFFPSLSDLAFLIPIVVLFWCTTGVGWLLTDSDTGWHIRTGEWMLNNGRVPRLTFSRSRRLASLGLPGSGYQMFSWRQSTEAAAWPELFLPACCSSVPRRFASTGTP